MLTIITSNNISYILCCKVLKQLRIFNKSFIKMSLRSKYFFSLNKLVAKNCFKVTNLKIFSAVS